MEEIRLVEWRKAYEKGDKVAERMSLVFDEIARESTAIGPVALVSHGGPIAYLLLSLGIEEVHYRYSGKNSMAPIPCLLQGYGQQSGMRRIKPGI